MAPQLDELRPPSSSAKEEEKASPSSRGTNLPPSGSNKEHIKVSFPDEPAQTDEQLIAATEGPPQPAEAGMSRFEKLISRMSSAGRDVGPPSRRQSIISRVVKGPTQLGFLSRLRNLRSRMETQQPVAGPVGASRRRLKTMGSVNGVDIREMSSSVLVDQRRMDRVARERYQGVPDKLKALISKAELDVLEELFESSDTDGSGLIGVEELPTMLRVLGLNPLEFTVKALLKEFDTSADGELNFGEFVSLWYAYREERGKEDVTLEMAFKFFDKDDSDSIQRAEFEEVMTELGDPLSGEEIELFFSLVDKEGTGSITKEQFMLFCGPEGSMALSTFHQEAREDDEPTSPRSQS